MITSIAHSKSDSVSLFPFSFACPRITSISETVSRKKMQSVVVSVGFNQKHNVSLTRTIKTSLEGNVANGRVAVYECYLLELTSKGCNFSYFRDLKFRILTPIITFEYFLKIFVTSWHRSSRSCAIQSFIDPVVSKQSTTSVYSVVGAAGFGSLCNVLSSS